MPPVIGLDFGTTNSAIAVADAGKEATLASFPAGSVTTTSFRSILYFPSKDRGSSVKAETKAGPEAISSYLEADSKGRLILSVKSYLASRLFTSTQINGRFYTLEDLIAIILRRLRTTVVEQFGVSATSVVIGQPVRFAGAETEADETSKTRSNVGVSSRIQADVQSIATCVKSLFTQHNVNYSDVGSVFLTGGSSFVPYMRRFFAKTFGSQKLKGGEELTTVAKGLALRALEGP